MRITIEVSDELIEKALSYAPLKTKKAVIEIALKDYIHQQARLELVKLFGKVEWEGNLDQMRTDITPNHWD